MEKRLAIHGGLPTRSKYLPYAQQWIDEEDIRAVVDVLQSDFITTGPTVTQFEEAFAQYVGAKYAISFANGTAALHAACFAAGIRPGDEVITTSMTFAASSNCILYMGGTPVFADIDPITYQIDPEEIKKKITPKTKAIIPVHYTGYPVDLAPILSLAKEHHLVIIEDAAHALGATYKGKKIGSISDMTMFSLHPVKHITTGEGGMITTNNEEYAKKLRLFRTHGITRDSTELMNHHGPWYYEMQLLGYNYRLTDIQAALGLSQLKKVDSMIERRKEIVEQYTQHFSPIEEIICPPVSMDSSWHLYVIRLNLDKLTTDRKTIFESLLKENIGVNVHYLPVHLHPYYQKLGYSKGLCPIAENMYEDIITLPLFPKMTDCDVQDVIHAVTKVIHYYRKKG